MSRPDESNRHAPDSDPPPSRMRRLLDWLQRRTDFDARDHWWRLLDLLEAKHGLRRGLYAVFATVILAAAAWMWVYPWWHQRNAISIARGWLAAGKLDQAAISVKDALKVAPERPESWQLAATLARLKGNKAKALDCSRHAAGLNPGNLNLALAWASDALIGDQPDEAQNALATLSADALAASPHAQRMLGEIARRNGDYAAARDFFEAARRLDGPLPVDEVPLGTVMINARDRTERRQGLDLLAKWAPDPEWGANALRALLGDAILHDDNAAMLRWADALRAHTRCTLGDIPNCLLALSKADETRFAAVLALMEKKHAADSGNIALLVSWLNQIGRSRDAIRWINSLPPALTRKLPAAVGIAEALRQTSDWPSLLAWTRDADWGDTLESMRLAYAMQAARRLGQTGLAKELWTTLQSRADTDSGRTLFAADTLYTWGLHDEAVTLLWAVSDQPEVAVQALGTLARYYQVERDAAGQFRAFRQLHSLRSQDPSIANNYAFFATLTGNDLNTAEQIARDNARAAPDNPAYLATYALVLCTQNRAAEALTVLAPVSADWEKRPAITLSYGLALAGTHRKEEARTVLSTLPPDTLTPQETGLIKKALE